MWFWQYYVLNMIRLKLDIVSRILDDVLLLNVCQLHLAIYAYLLVHIHKRSDVYFLIHIHKRSEGFRVCLILCCKVVEISSKQLQVISTKSLSRHISCPGVYQRKGPYLLNYTDPGTSSLALFLPLRLLHS